MCVCVCVHARDSKMKVLQEVHSLTFYKKESNILFVLESTENRN